MKIRTAAANQHDFPASRAFERVQSGLTFRNRAKIPMQPPAGTSRTARTLSAVE
jgi:hypothetical protein